MTRRDAAWLEQERAKRAQWPKGAQLPHAADGTIDGELLVASKAPEPPRVLERDVLSAVRDALSVHPEVDRVFRVNSGAHVAGEGESRRFVRYHDIPGMSDLWVWLKPRHGTRQAFIEVKRPGEKASDKQLGFLKAVVLRGHIGFVTDDALDAWNRFTLAVNG